MKQIAIVLGAGFLLAALTAGAKGQIEVSVSPKVGFEPANLVVGVMTERNADNRVLRVVAESDGFASSSERQLEGEASPRFATFEFRGVPAGVYDIHASLIDPNGNTRAQAEATATVVSIADDR